MPAPRPFPVTGLLPVTGLVAALAALAAGCAPTEPGPSTTLTDPTLAGGLYSTGGGLVVAAELREIDGRLGVCGAWARGRQSVLSEGSDRDVLATGSISAAGDRLVQGLAHLPQVPLAEDYQGAPADCVLTDRAWSPALADVSPEIRLPRQVIANESAGDPYDDGGGGGIVVRFRQTPHWPRGI